tara:strand:+ start:333 stop:515 length:183 start_codon:yes stop_codon:yes gene_type:complete
MNISKRGGKREGAGRPRKENKNILTAIRLPPDILHWINEQDGSRAAVIIKAIDRFRQTDT